MKNILSQSFSLTAGIGLTLTDNKGVNKMNETLEKRLELYQKAQKDSEIGFISFKHAFLIDIIRFGTNSSQKAKSMN